VVGIETRAPKGHMMVVTIGEYLGVGGREAEKEMIRDQVLRAEL
jgi:hypothetical protein